MIIIYISQRAWRPSVNQIINYDAGIVLIDLHQLNVKTTSDNTNQRHWIRGNLMSTKNRTRRTTTHSINFPSKWLNKLTSLLSKRVRNFSAWVAARSLPSRLTSEKRACYTSIKSDEEWTSRSSSEQDDIVNSLNYEGIAVIELQFYHFSDSDRPLLALSQTK